MQASKLAPACGTDLGFGSCNPRAHRSPKFQDLTPVVAWPPERLGPFSTARERIFVQHAFGPIDCSTAQAMRRWVLLQDPAYTLVHYHI